MNAKYVLALGSVMLLAACGGGNDSLPKSCEEMIDWHMKKTAEIVEAEKNDELDALGIPVFFFRQTLEIDVIGMLEEWGDNDTSTKDFAEGKSSEVIERAKKYYAAKFEEVEKEKGKKNAELFREEVEKTCKKVTDKSIEDYTPKKK